MQSQNTTKKNNKSRSAPSKKKVVSKRRQRQSNSSMPMTNFGNVRFNNNIENNKFRYRRTELVSTIITSIGGPAFQIDLRLRLNPGSEKTFPWLSGIAQHYESYRFHNLKFHYVTRSPTTATGFIYLSPDYDAADAAPSGPALEAIVANNSDTVETAIWQNKTLVLSPQKMNRLFKAHSVMDDLRFASTKQDQKTLDVGQLFIVEESTFGVSTKLGKLFVEYDVEFFEAQKPFEPVDSNGISYQGDNNVVKTNTVNVFGQSPFAGLKNAVNDEILSPVAGPFPSETGFSFNRAWEGLVNVHTLMTGSNMTSVPNLLLNKQTSIDNPDNLKLMDKIPNIDTNALEKYRQYWVRANAGDTLGLGPLNTVDGLANALNYLKITLGGSQVSAF